MLTINIFVNMYVLSKNSSSVHLAHFYMGL